MVDVISSKPGGADNLPHLTAVTPAEDARTVMLNRISWSAVLAGAATALVVQLLLNMLAVGVGLAALSPLSGDNPSAATFTVAAGLWWIASGMFAAAVGGYVAGRACGKPVETTAALHGLVAWAAATLVVMYLLTTAVGSIAGGALGAVSSVVGGLGRTAAQTAGPALANAADPFGAIERQVRDAAGGTDPAAARDSAVAAMRALLTGDAAGQNQARDQAAQALARAANIPVEEARTRIGQYEQQYRQAAETAKQRAAEAAEATRKAVSRAALFSFLGLLLGAMAAWFCGREGRVEPIVTSDAATFGGRG